MDRLNSIFHHLQPNETFAIEVDQATVHAQAKEHPEAFWAAAAKEITWNKPPTKILDSSKAPIYRWFVDGELNTCYNAVDAHVKAGHANRNALIYDSPVTNTQLKITYGELLEKVSKVAGILCRHKVQKGDTVLIYMPMIPETLVAMLACARIGAIHSVVFGGFAPKELVKRIEDSQPKLVFSASCGIELKGPIPYKPLLDEAVELSSWKPPVVIIYQRNQLKAKLIPNRDFDWNDEYNLASATPCVPVESTHPLYVLYTSGTTGKSKGVLRDHGGYAVALKWSMKNVYAVEPGDVFWAASDFGWVVGHSYIVYGPLFQGCTTVIYEGKPIGTPDPGAFWRVVQQYNVRCMSTAPTVLRTLKKEDPEAKFIHKYPRPSLKSLFLVGERSDPDSLKWAAGHLNIPIVDHWWMTETGWAITAQCLGIKLTPSKVGAAGMPVPGFNVEVLDDQGKEVPRNAFGNISIKLPLPPGSMPTLYKNDERFVSSYLTRFPGYFDTGDAGYQDQQGYVYVMSRTDDLINVAGHRLSTGGIEEVIANHPKIAEVAVIGAADKLKGEKPLGFIVLKSGIDPASAQTIVNETYTLVRQSIGAFACYDKAYIVQRLPKTRSGKILRRTLRNIVNKEKYDIPPTIDDPAALQEIEQIINNKAK